MPGPSGYAAHSDDEALLLVESLLHELIAAGTLTIDRAVAVVEIAANARDQVRQDYGTRDAEAAIALDAILATLRRDQRPLASPL